MIVVTISLVMVVNSRVNLVSGARGHGDYFNKNIRKINKRSGESSFSLCHRFKQLHFNFIPKGDNHFKRCLKHFTTQTLQRGETVSLF